MDEFIIAEAAICVGKSTTWGTSSTFVSVRPITAGATICSCVGKFTTGKDSSNAGTVWPVTVRATICACMGGFLRAPWGALKLSWSTSLTGALLSASAEDYTDSTDCYAADDTVSGPIHTVNSTSKKNPHLPALVAAHEWSKFGAPLSHMQCLKLSQKSCRSSCLESQIINMKLKTINKKYPVLLQSCRPRTGGPVRISNTAHTVRVSFAVYDSPESEFSLDGSVFWSTS